MLRAKHLVSLRSRAPVGLRFAKFGSGEDIRSDEIEREVCLYKVLDITSTATAAEIKAAFRVKAKLLHPDGQQGDREAFVRLLSAYQVLIDPRSRELYDLSHSEGQPGVLRRAAASGVSAAAAGDEEVDIDLSWGLSELFKHDRSRAEGQQQNKLDRLRAELQSDFHAALRHAYLGPRLQRDSPNALPEAFEADERSEPDCPELLALVCGRQVLGVVRERRLHLLAQQAAQQATLEEQRQALLGHAAAAATATSGGSSAASPAVPSLSSPGGQQCVADCDASSVTDAAEAGSSGEPQAGFAGQQGRQGQQQGQQQRGSEEDDDADILEYVSSDGDVLATAVRRFPRRRHQQQQQGHPPGTLDTGAEPAGTFSPGRQQQQGQDDPPAAAISFFQGERLLGTLQAEHEAATGASASAARFLSPDGRHTHTVLRSNTPLVRSLMFAAEPSVGVKKRTTICRCRRAWLPPSTLWLFRPRSHRHDIGGWALEWGGDRQRSHPAWLDPAIFVLTAGFDSLDYERARQTPQGLFGRLRRGDEASGGPLAWLRAMLRFHGK